MGTTAFLLKDSGGSIKQIFNFCSAVILKQQISYRNLTLKSVVESY
ncbi:hypothetical protein LEP1GSC111_3400 [Leptospira interrogans str. UT126]|nr:hypothetical protein LEP1GSC111_3400 [Leptospira interrogans str. UT126]